MRVNSRADLEATAHTCAFFAARTFRAGRYIFDGNAGRRRRRQARRGGLSLKTGRCRRVRFGGSGHGATQSNCRTGGSGGQGMSKITRGDPSNLKNVRRNIYHHFIRVDNPKSLIFLSRQLARDAEGNLVGPGDMAEQTRQCIRNMRTVLEVAGGTLEDIVRSWSTQTICASSGKLWRLVPSFLWPSCRQARLWR